MSGINCNIIRDLLPGYVEGLTSNETNEAVKKHLSECSECSKIISDMADGEDFGKNEDIREIDYLKKVKRKSRKIILIIFGGLILLGIITFCCYGIFGISTRGYTAENIHLTDAVLEADIFLNYNNYGITDVKTNETDGVVTIDVHSAPSVFRKKSSYYLRLPVSKKTTRVQTSNGQVLWENGREIPKKIDEIYNKKVKYVGAAPEVIHLLRAIDMYSVLKCRDYSIHLLTDSEPYGLEIYNINSYDDMFYSFSDEGYVKKLEWCSYLILSCIENIDYVRFEYVSPSGKNKVYQLTVDEANEFLAASDISIKSSANKSIKDWSQSRWEIKVLTDALDIYLAD